MIQVSCPRARLRSGTLRASIGLTQIEAEGLHAKVGTETRAQGWRVS
jgi:hypothetical protein